MVRSSEKIDLRYPEYWNRDPNLWGDIVDWDIYFIDKLPSCTSREAHSALSSELNLLIKELPTNSRRYKKALAIRASIKKNDAEAADVWEHARKLRKIAIDKRVSKERITGVAMHATADAAEESFINSVTIQEHASTLKRRASSIIDDHEEDVEDGDRDDNDQPIHETIEVNFSSKRKMTSPSFSDKNTRESINGVFDDEDGDEIFERMQNPLTYMEHENSAIWISDDDKEDVLIELCLPKEEHTEMIERNEIDNGLLGRNWKKWTALLRETQKKSPHKHCPENYCIIRCGAGIRPSNWMKENIYQSLQTVLPKADRTSFVDFKSYMLNIFKEKSLKSMQQAIRSRAPPIDEPLGSKHYIIDQVFAQFAQKVFMPDNGDSDIKLSEICYNYLALWPCMYAAISGLTSDLGDLKFQPGEKNLDAIDEIRRFRHLEESHMKVDGVAYTELNHIELLSMEVTGHYGLHDKPRAAWDHVKGLCALLAMLSRIAYVFPHGSIELFQEIRVAFVHAHEKALHLWLFSMPSPGIFLMQRISKAVVPSTFDEALLLCELVNFLWTLRIEVLKTTKILEKLKKSHMEKTLAIQLGESRRHHLYDVLRPVTSLPKSKITTMTLDKKTEYARVGEHVLPGSSPIRED